VPGRPAAFTTGGKGTGMTASGRHYLGEGQAHDGQRPSLPGQTLPSKCVSDLMR
jgi:hypothetical protein